MVSIVCPSHLTAFLFSYLLAREDVGEVDRYCLLRVDGVLHRDLSVLGGKVVNWQGPKELLRGESCPGGHFSLMAPLFVSFPKV